MMVWNQENSLQTVELRDIIESGVKLWDFDYPSFYQGADKAAFEQKVIDHFWLRQIGTETVGRFLHYFRRTVREIMPLYIQRYESVELMKDPEIRPLDNYNMIEEYEGEDSSTGSTATSGTDSTTTKHSANANDQITGQEKKTDAHSDTPQSQLIWPENPVLGDIQVEYASDVTQGATYNNEGKTSQAEENGTTSGSSESETESSETGTKKHKLTRRGNIGVTTYAQLLQGYRETFINIDMEIINELESCFLGVY